MDVVLLERVPKLGGIGDVVRVKTGYARNYLLPTGKALRATDENLERFRQARERLEKENAERRGSAEVAAKALDGQRLRVIRRAKETGQLYGSVTARDITRLCAEAGYDVGRGQVLLDRPLKELGLHKVSVMLHPEVEASLAVEIARTEEESLLDEDEEDEEGEIAQALDETHEDSAEAGESEDGGQSEKSVDNPDLA